MKDLFTDLRQQQFALAKTITSKLVATFGTQKAPNFSVIAAHVLNDDAAEIKIEGLDLELFMILCENEAESKVLNAVMGYIDWVAVRIILSKRWKPRKLTMLSEKNLARIAEYYGIKGATLRFTIEHMHECKELPLLGKVKHGKLVPNRTALNQWKKAFDWSKQTSDKNESSIQS